MSSRREFLAGLSAFSLSSQLKCKSSYPHNFTSEFDWSKVRSHFIQSTNNPLNLNNGSGSNMPSPILEKYLSYTREINAFAPYEILNKWTPKIQEGQQKLTRFLQSQNGCLTFVLNTTSALNTIISGLPFSESDEIINNSADYPHAVSALDNRAKKDKLKIKTLNIDFFASTNEEIIDAYTKAITSKTKLIYLTYITHSKGHIYPIKEICEIARDKGIETLVDAAHAIGQINHSIQEIGCDYYATSLHKWMNAPLGSGLMYIANNKIEKINPIEAFPQKVSDQPVKFSYLGTRAFQNEITINDAFEYMQDIGIDRKEERFKSLKNYWIDKLQSIKDFKLYTDPERSAGVGSFNINNLPASIIKKTLLNKYNIHVKQSLDPISKLGILRISPDIYNNFDDLDYFVNAMTEIVKNK